MWDTIRNIYALISEKNRFKFKILILLIFFMSFFEIIGLALILPFLLLVSNIDIIQKNKYIYQIYTYLGFQNSFDFLCFIGALAVLFSFFGMLLSVYTNIKLTKFSNDIGADFSVKLLSLYLSGELREKSKEDIKEAKTKILTETVTVANNIVLPSLMIIAKSILIFVLFGILLYINPAVTLLLVFALFGIYALLFYFSNKKIKYNAKKIEYLKQERNNMVNSALTSKQRIAGEKQRSLVKEYFKQVYELSKHQSFNNVVSKLPRYLMMFLVLTAVVAVSIYIVYVYNGQVDGIIHEMLLFIVVGLKLLPQVQNVFINYLKIKSKMSSFLRIKKDLKEAYK